MATGLLPILYERVICPAQVIAECCHPSAPGALRSFLVSPPEWLHIEPAPLVSEAVSEGLEPGESAAIALAGEYTGSVLLIDERKGRRRAESRRLRVAGTINVLAEAGVAGLIDFQGIVAQLLQTTNFRITDAVVERAWLEAQP